MPPKHPATHRTPPGSSATWPEKPILKLSRKPGTCMRKQVGVKSCWPPFSPQYLQSFCSPSPDPCYTDSQGLSHLKFYTTILYFLILFQTLFVTHFLHLSECGKILHINCSKSIGQILVTKKLQLLEVHSLTIYQPCLAIQTAQGHFNSPIALN